MEEIQEAITSYALHGGEDEGVFIIDAAPQLLKTLRVAVEMRDALAEADKSGCIGRGCTVCTRCTTALKSFDNSISTIL